METTNRKKINNLKQLEFENNFTFLAKTFLELKKKNKSKRVDEMIEALNGIFHYTHNLEQDQYYWDKSLSMLRSDKIRAIERARRSESELAEVKDKLKNYIKTYG